MTNFFFKYTSVLTNDKISNDQIIMFKYQIATQNAYTHKHAVITKTIFFSAKQLNFTSFSAVVDLSYYAIL